MTPTDPFPAACRSFNWAIAENDASNDLTPSPAGTVALADVPAVELPPHAARTMANAPVDANKVNVRSVRNCFPLLRLKAFRRAEVILCRAEDPPRKEQAPSVRTAL